MVRQEADALFRQLAGPDVADRDGGMGSTREIDTMHDEFDREGTVRSCVKLAFEDPVRVLHEALQGDPIPNASRKRLADEIGRRETREGR